MKEVADMDHLPFLKQPTFLWMCLLAAFLPPVSSIPYPCVISTNEARCCSECPPGTGVTSACNATSDTKCAPCELNSTYSTVRSHNLACTPCRVCPKNSIQIQLCNTTHDAVCQCDTNNFGEENPHHCAPCDICPAGQGLVEVCTLVKNTTCGMCGEGTYSTGPGLEPCRPCTVCRENQLLFQRCTTTQDTICIDITPVKPSVVPFFLKTAATVADDGTQGGKSDALPVYCAFLAGVVAGLVAYVIVLQVRRSRARRTKATYTPSSGSVREGARLAPGGSTSQIPTQGSDSGVFVDNEVKTVAVSPSFRVRDLPPAFKRALQTSVHAQPDNRGGWRSLARQLGYNSSRASAFKTRANRDDVLPARYLLSDWSKRSHATVGALQVALHKIGRDDVSLMFQSDQIQAQSNHRRSRESVNIPLVRSNSTNQDYRSKSIGLNNLEREPEGAAEPEPVSPRSHRNNRRSMGMNLGGSQRLVNI